MFGQSLNIIWVWDGPTHLLLLYFTRFSQWIDRGLRVAAGDRQPRAPEQEKEGKGEDRASSAFYEKNGIACPKW